MAKPMSPSWPHRSKSEPRLHVDIRGKDKKIHSVVKDPMGAYAIAMVQREDERRKKGRS